MCMYSSSADSRQQAAPQALSHHNNCPLSTGMNICMYAYISSCMHEGTQISQPAINVCVSVCVCMCVCARAHTRSCVNLQYLDQRGQAFCRCC